MSAIFAIVADVIISIITSLWFWIIIISGLIIFLLLSCYRRLKTAALEKLEYARAFTSDGVFVGESLELIEQIENHSWFPLFSVRVEFFVPAGITIDELSCKEYTKVTSFCFVPPYSVTQKRHTITPDRRDHYKLNTATIVYRKNEFMFSDQINFYAYPNYDDTKIPIDCDLYHAGDAISERKYIEDPFFISGIRPYRAGDPMRSVNFKASLRSFRGGVRQLLCNNYDSSRNYDSMIFLDLTTYSQRSLNAEYQLELGLRYACFLAAETIKNAGRIGFATNCEIGELKYVYLPCSSGDAHTKALLENFAELASFSRRDYSMTAIVRSVLPNLSPGTDIYLITPYVEDELARILSVAERLGCSVQTFFLSEGGM